MKRALVSTYNKDGLVELVQCLVDHGVEIVSTGGTYRYLTDQGFTVTDVSSVTNFPEMLDGRVKTLHPYVHGGILAIRSSQEHMNTLESHGIKTIDFVVVNLYPFFDKVKESLPFEEMIEFIDIGGPTMLRSAAKSFKDVVVLTHKEDYADVIKSMNTRGEVSFEKRKDLAAKVFNLTSAYDAAISQFLMDDAFPEYLTISYKKSAQMRYGENMHQQAAYYVDQMQESAMNQFEQLHGKSLSFNNIRDMDLAWKVVSEFDEPCCCAVKHSTPCGVATAEDIYSAYQKAYDADPVSIFGGIVAFNRVVDKKTAIQLKDVFLEIVMAPEFTSEALSVLSQKKNLRIIQCPCKPCDRYTYTKVDGGLLVQETNQSLFDELCLVTEKSLTQQQQDDLLFAFKVSKFVKSNAIVIAHKGQTLGIGGGEVSRIWAAEKALERAYSMYKNSINQVIDMDSFRDVGVVMASDAFFPFKDVVELAASYGVSSIIQPGGSIRDHESIEACNQLGIAMILSGVRHFLH